MVFQGPGPSRPFHGCVHHVVSETLAVGLGGSAASWPGAPGVRASKPGSGSLARWRHPHLSTEPQRGLTLVFSGLLMLW